MIKSCLLCGTCHLITNNFHRLTQQGVKYTVSKLYTDFPTLKEALICHHSIQNVMWSHIVLITNCGIIFALQTLLISWIFFNCLQSFRSLFYQLIVYSEIIWMSKTKTGRIEQARTLDLHVQDKNLRLCKPIDD